jgi:hypothetical protein
VHINGTGYTDYFTDGTKTVSFPGDPAIDANLAKANAQTPQHAGLRWVGTGASYLYDTPSKALDVGDYAQQPDGSYVEHLAATTYTDATSTSAVPDRITTTTSNPGI